SHPCAAFSSLPLAFAPSPCSPAASFATPLPTSLRPFSTISVLSATFASLNAADGQSHTRSSPANPDRFVPVHALHRSVPASDRHDGPSAKRIGRQGRSSVRELHRRSGPRQPGRSARLRRPFWRRQESLAVFDRPQGLNRLAKRKRFRPRSSAQHG